MFYQGKRKAAKQEALAKITAENAVHFAKITEEIRQKIAAIETITDIGERYLAFQSCEKNIHDHIRAAKERTRDQIISFQHPTKAAYQRAGTGIRVVGLFAATGAVFVMFATGGTPLLLLAAMGSGLGSELIADEVALSGRSPHEAEMIKFNEGENAFGSAMKTLLENIARQKLLIQGDLRGLLMSRHAKDLCDKVPAIKDAFARAAIEESLLHRPVVLNKPKPPAPKP